MAVKATAVWRVRPSGSNINGGGYDPGISGAATDYSQQNSAQASGTHGSTSGSSTTFTDSTAAAFTSAMVGNAIYITGGGATTGWYFVTAFTDASDVVLDRSPGTSISGSTWHLGGGWADPFVNVNSGPLVAGNIVYILGSGVPNPASYTYDYTASSFYTPPAGSDSVGRIQLLADPNTPSYGAGGYPVIKANGSNVTYYGANGALYTTFSGLWFVAQSNEVGVITNFNNVLVTNCVCDQFGWDSGFVTASVGPIVFNEVFSSHAVRGTQANYAMGSQNNYTGLIMFNNIHDTVGGGIYINVAGNYSNNIVAKCGGIGINVNGTFSGLNDAVAVANISGNTIDGNTGNGIEVVVQANLSNCLIFGNIISNHTTAGKSGIVVDTGTTAANDAVKIFSNYNTFYNNTSNVSGISLGANDTALGSSPYTGVSTEDYSLNKSVVTTAMGFPAGPYPQHLSGKTSVTTYLYPGAAQPTASGGGGGTTAHGFIV